MKGQPFKRLIALVAACNLATSNPGFSPLTEEQAKSALYNYRSRGKGEGKTNRANPHKHMSQVRTARKAHNKAKRT